MFRLYIDEDALQIALVAAARAVGFDCLTANEANMRGRSDEEQLSRSTLEGRVLYTKNTADFCRLDAQWRAANRRHAGVIVVTDQRAPIGVQVRALLRLAEAKSADEMAGRLEFLLNHRPWGAPAS